jgi:hypothetical protein
VTAYSEQGHNCLATFTCTGLVGRSRSCDRGLHQYGRLVAHRIAATADSLGAHPRPGPTLRPTSLAVYGSDPEPAHDRVLVRAALARGGDVSGSTKEPRGRKPAAMGRSGHRSNNPVLAGSVLGRYFTRRSTRASRHITCGERGLVRQVAADICRCAGGRAAALLDTGRFSRLSPQRPHWETSQSLARAFSLRTVPGGGMAKVELSG